MRSRNRLLHCTSLVTVLVFTVSALVASGAASAEPNAPSEPQAIARLIADVARADQRLADLGAAVDSEQEAVQNH